MAATIRLARYGRSNHAFYRISVADTRKASTGRFIQQIGYYDPIKDPPEVKIDQEKAMKWLNEGAVLSPTVKSLFKHEGLLDKFQQVKAGKSPDEVELKPIQWKKSKAKLSKKVLGKQKAEADTKIAAKAEATKKADEVKKAAVEAKTEVPKAEVPKAEVPKAEEPKAEEPKAEEPKAEAAPEEEKT